MSRGLGDVYKRQVPSDIDHERFSWVREAADEFMGLLTDKSIRAGR